MRSLVILATVAFAFAGGSVAMGEVASVIAFDDATCGAWTAEHRLNSRKSAQYEAWTFGYLSGWSVTTTVAGNPLAKTDSAGIIKWINNYCVAHPLDKLITAADHLIDELQKH
jgi:hypothetical protein